MMNNKLRFLFWGINSGYTSSHTAISIPRYTTTILCSVVCFTASRTVSLSVEDNLPRHCGETVGRIWCQQLCSGIR